MGTPWCPGRRPLIHIVTVWTNPTLTSRPVDQAHRKQILPMPIETNACMHANPSHTSAPSVIQHCHSGWQEIYFWAGCNLYFNGLCIGCPNHAGRCLAWWASPWHPTGHFLRDTAASKDYLAAFAAQAPITQLAAAMARSDLLTKAYT